MKLSLDSFGSICTQLSLQYHKGLFGYHLVGRGPSQRQTGILRHFGAFIEPQKACLGTQKAFKGVLVHF